MSVTVLVSVMQVGEFVEVFNNSTTDPAAWVALLTKIDKKGYTVNWLSHRQCSMLLQPCSLCTAH